MQRRTSEVCGTQCVHSGSIACMCSKNMNLCPIHASKIVGMRTQPVRMVSSRACARAISGMIVCKVWQDRLQLHAEMTALQSPNLSPDALWKYAPAFALLKQRCVCFTPASPTSRPFLCSVFIQPLPFPERAGSFSHRPTAPQPVCAEPFIWAAQR